MPKLRPIKSRPQKALKATQPNVGIEVAYRRALDKMIMEMHASVLYWVRAAYKANEPRIAQDATPAEVLRKSVANLAKRWQRQFDEAAEKLADYFSSAVEARSTSALKKILKDGGWSVKFQMTPAMRDVFQATVNQNVALIRSIPSKYFTDIEGMVQRSVAAGRDLKQLTDDLQSAYGVTRRRAILIARDQNNKATSSFTKARRLECGITEAIWQHSHAGKEPRPSHVAMNGKRFKIAEGMWDPHEQEWIQPGFLINCRCSSRPIVEGFS